MLPAKDPMRMNDDEQSEPPENGEIVENEVLRAARLASEQAAAAEAGAPDPAKAKKGKLGWTAGVGIGVGSAALLAALLYANRKRD
jgi:hypothetical protein